MEGAGTLKLILVSLASLPRNLTSTEKTNGHLILFVELGFAKHMNAHSCGIYLPSDNAWRVLGLRGGCWESVAAQWAYPSLVYSAGW